MMVEYAIDVLAVAQQKSSGRLVAIAPLVIGFADEEPATGAKPRLPRLTYTIDEAAKMLGISRNSAYIAARNDKLPVPTIRIGKRMLVSKYLLDKLLD